MDVFCSTIIPTIGRDTLSRAVRSVLNQGFHAAGFEVIVVNDSGRPLPEMDWQQSDKVRVLDTNRRERSVARNTGAAIARGKYLHFLDDDDAILPGALEAFWMLDRVKGDHVIWLYGSYQTVDNVGTLIATYHPRIVGNITGLLVAGESIPFQASLLRTRAFFETGGFDPNLSYAEDRDLGRRISLYGDVTWISAVVAQIRIGEAGSTSDWSKKGAADRLGREKALRIHGATARLRASANTPYLRGRMSRAYFASASWNLRRRAGFTALSRMTTGLAFAGLQVLTPDFWLGLRTKIE